MKHLEDILNIIREKNLWRKTVAYQQIDGNYVMLNEKKCLMLASNNYLGLTHNDKIQQASIAAIVKYGTGSGGARLTTGNYPLYDELELSIAQFKGTEAALVFNTGYMANVGVISALCLKNDVIFSDELNHASIIDGCRLAKAETKVYKHNDMTDLKLLLQNTVCAGRKWIITDGVFSMDGDIAPLDEIVALAQEYGAEIIVDDAHATGVIGDGKGSAHHFGLKAEVAVQIGTLSKAIGSEGGFVAGSQILVDYLRNVARSFIFSTALAPAVVCASIRAIKEIQDNDKLVNTLSVNSLFMRECLMAEGLTVIDGETPIIPIIIGDAARTLEIKEKCQDKGLIVSAIRPPTVPVGTSRLRLTVMATHTKADLKAAAKIIADIIKETV